MRIADATVVVTGGRGFLGRHVTEELERHGARAIPLGSADYDLRRRAEVDRMLANTNPDAVVHLAAVVGGIGANRSQPGRFFYENAIMGIELLEACRVGNVSKVVVSGTVCAYPKHAPVPFQEAGLWDGYPEETNAPYGLARRCCWSSISGPVRHERGLPHAGESLRSPTTTSTPTARTCSPP